MKKQIEENGITYNLVGDYHIPDLKIPPQKEQPAFGKYGRLHLAFIRNKHPYAYVGLIKDGNLCRHVNRVDKQVNEMFEQLVKQMAKEQGVTEQLKADDQMKWVSMMNNIRNAANEIVLKDLIYN